MNRWAKAIEARAKIHSYPIAIRGSELSLSNTDLLEFTKKSLNKFREVRLEPQDRILIVCKDSLSSVLAVIGLLSNDIVGLSISPRTPVLQMLKYFDTFLASGIVTDCEDHSEVRRLLELLATRQDQAPLKTINLNLSLKLFVLGKPQSRLEYTPPSELGWTLLTSGSTGDAKIVMISQDDLAHRAEGEIRDFGLRQGNRILNALPFSHDLGLNQILTTLLGDLQLTITQSPFITKVVALLRDGDFNGLTGTPHLWVEYLRHAKSSDCPKLDYLTISGGLLSAKKYTNLKACFPHTRIIRTYGQTETFRTFLSDDPDGASFAQPIGGAMANVLNDQLRPCTTGETGELVHQGSGTMMGYFADPQLTSKKLGPIEGLKGSWIKTGDYFSIEAGQRFLFQGRRDHLIKRYEQRFSLNEVEHSIEALAGIREVVAAIVKTDESNPKGFVLWAFVVSDSNHKLDKAEILRHCKETLMYWAWPDGVTFLTKFPLTGSGKVDRVALSEQIPIDK